MNADNTNESWQLPTKAADADDFDGDDLYHFLITCSKTEKLENTLTGGDFLNNL